MIGCELHSKRGPSHVHLHLEPPIFIHQENWQFCDCDVFNRTKNNHREDEKKIQTASPFYTLQFINIGSNLHLQYFFETCFFLIHSSLHIYSQPLSTLLHLLYTADNFHKIQLYLQSSTWHKQHYSL